MRVNSSFTGFFTNRFVLRIGLRIPIAIGIGTIFFIASSFTKPSDRDVRAKEVNLIIRLIGDRLLLQSGDLTSRVLPVAEIKEGTFLLTFENEFVFNHDSLMLLTHSSFPKSQFPSGYTVTVHECMTASIVYGFQINKNSPDILACKGRSQPSGCYKIEISFPDLYKNVEQAKVDIDQRTQEHKSINVDSPEANSIPIPIGIGTEELKSSNVDPQETNSIPITIGTTFDFPLISLVCSGMMLLLSVVLLNKRFGKSLAAVPVQNQNHAIAEESVPVLPALGKFLFDLKEQRLVLGNEVVSLTDKECRILELLNENFGELIPRETLMQKIWIDEGVITGRSLDMFVSKLRKKLSGDPELRITNVHGKGYKLETPGL